MAEFQADGRGRPGDNSMVGEEIREFAASWSTSKGFAAYVDALRAQARGELADQRGRTLRYWATTSGQFGQRPVHG